jgi:hypothetical protein
MTEQTNQGYGQQDPSDSADAYNVLIFTIEQMLAQISTMKLVKVQAVDSDAKTVDVLPLVNQLDGAGNSTPHGTIFGIPYFVYQAGANAIILTPEVDDIGVMVCADRDISSVKSTKAQANPGSLRKLDAADGVYFGGVLNGAATQTIAITDDGIKLSDKNNHVIEMKADGIHLTGPVFVDGALQLSGSIEALDGSIYAGDIKTKGAVVAGQGTADQVGLQTHKHAGVTIGAATTLAPTAGT